MCDSIIEMKRLHGWCADYLPQHQYAVANSDGLLKCGITRAAIAFAVAHDNERQYAWQPQSTAIWALSGSDEQTARFQVDGDELQIVDYDDTQPIYLRVIYRKTYAKWMVRESNRADDFDWCLLSDKRAADAIDWGVGR